MIKLSRQIFSSLLLGWLEPTWFQRLDRRATRIAKKKENKDFHNDFFIRIYNDPLSVLPKKRYSRVLSWWGQREEKEERKKERGEKERGKKRAEEKKKIRKRKVEKGKEKRKKKNEKIRGKAKK